MTSLGDQGSQVRVLSPELLPRVTITSDLPDTSALLLAASRMLDGQVAAVRITDVRERGQGSTGPISYCESCAHSPF
jgi:hypothetical protein